MDKPFLRFLADECCDFAVVRTLRAEGYDVVAVGEEMERSDDEQLIERAAREQRIFITEDKDFGWLIYAAHKQSPGVILIRFPGDARTSLAETIKRLVSEEEESLPGSFVVVQPGYIRIRSRPL